jgi:hypothetical protein
MDTINALDTMILSAFKEAHEAREHHCATLGIAKFQVLSPRRLGDSFQALATLPDTVDMRSPSLQMVLGKGISQQDSHCTLIATP